MPATTIVLEWSKAETGVGPSMAEGSHGCRPNWADFPVAASNNPAKGRVVLSRSNVKICWISHEFEFFMNHAIDRMNPTSPMRLYRTACSAAVLASARPYHQPMSRKDMMPTPSQPIKSWNILLAVTKIIIVIRNINKYLKNRLMLGSECIYHIENSIIDQVINRAIGINIMEKKSNLKLRDSFIVWIVIQCQFDIIISCPDWMNIILGSRLTIKEYEIIVFTYSGYDLMLEG